MSRLVRIVLNANSGAGGTNADQLTAMFAERGCDCVVTELRHGVDLRQVASRDASDTALIAAGGDGTVSAVAQAVAGTARVMGVLPLGTLNHFAKDLGLPLELDAAVTVAAGECTRQVDAAEVNGHVFVNNSSVGAYPLMVLDRERLRKGGKSKWFSTALASVKTFAVLWRMRVQVEVDGTRQSCRTPFVFVGNNDYCVEGPELGKRERVDRGELSVYLARGLGRWGVVKLGFAAMLGRAKKMPGFEEMKGQEVVLTMQHRRRPRVSLDGEVKRIRGPLVYRTRAAALTVLCASRDQG